MMKKRILHVYSSLMKYHLVNMIVNNVAVFPDFDNENFIANTDASGSAGMAKVGGGYSVSSPWLIPLRVALSRPDYVVFHGCFWRFAWVYMLICQILFLKVVYISWSTEVVDGGGLRARVLGVLRGQVLRNCYAVVFLSRGDLAQSVRRYGEIRRTDVISYFNPSYLEADSRMRAPDQVGGGARIQIGNDASEGNGHLQCMEALSKMGASGIKVALPMGYGAHDTAYVEKIKERARLAFGSNAELYEDLLTNADFDRLIDGCDGYMMASKGQRALYSVYRHLAAGRPVFLPDDAMLKMDLEQEGFEIASLDKVASLDPYEFRALCGTRNVRNVKIARDILSLGALQQKWEALLRCGRA